MVISFLSNKIDQERSGSRSALLSKLAFLIALSSKALVFQQRHGLFYNLLFISFSSPQ